jgi:hypothetical protein
VTEAHRPGPAPRRISQTAEPKQPSLLEKWARSSTRFNSARGLETKVPQSGSSRSGLLWEASKRGQMRSAETYEQYATECERIARSMSGEQRKSLLTIAEAWRELARDEKHRLPKSRDR